MNFCLSHRVAKALNADEDNCIRVVAASLTDDEASYLLAIKAKQPEDYSYADFSYLRYIGARCMDFTPSEDVLERRYLR